jgi:hypothetical protein
MYLIMLWGDISPILLSWNGLVCCNHDRQILTVGHWLDILRNVVFEVGCFLDEIKPEALHCEVEGKLKSLSSPFIWFNGLLILNFKN